MERPRHPARLAPLILGFTGTSELPIKSQARLEKDLASLVERWVPTSIVTGGCVGVDSFVHHWFRKSHPNILRKVVLPGNLQAVDLTVADSASGGLVKMPPRGKGSSYRERNEALVESCDLMAAFWTGQERSGTFMTMNIALRASKLPVSWETIFGVGLPDQEVRSRCSVVPTSRQLYTHPQVRAR